MSTEFWIYIAGLILTFLVPALFKWYQKKTTGQSFSIQKEFKIKWRRFEAHLNKKPFSGFSEWQKETLIVTYNTMNFGLHSIPFKNVKKAIRYTPKDSVLKEVSSILRLETDYYTYDIMISPYQLDKMNLPFAIEKEESSIFKGMYKVILIIVIIIIFFLFMILDKNGFSLSGFLTFGSSGF